MAHPAAPVPSSSSRQRTRLNKQASEFLANYARTINSYPRGTEKEHILTSIHAIPGNEGFTMGKLTSWFARHRQYSDIPILQDEEAILFPKLTPTHIQQLRVLLRKRNDPPENIISFWAGRIHADRDEVAAWVEYQKEQGRQQDPARVTDSPDVPLQQLVGELDSTSPSASVSPTVSEFPRPHLPTPAKSLSPSISPQTRVPSLPPIAVKVEESNRPCLSPASLFSTPSVLQTAVRAPYLESSALGSLPPLSSRLRTQWKSEAPAAIVLTGAPSHVEEDLSAALATTIRDSLGLDAPTESIPRTADEFAKQFAVVEKMIDTFVKKHESGHLARLGWDPSGVHLSGQRGRAT